jgi:hypothetical protein
LIQPVGINDTPKLSYVLIDSGAHGADFQVLQEQAAAPAFLIDFILPTDALPSLLREP